MSQPAPSRIRSFSEFYPFYLSEHRNVVCRRLHVIGDSAALVCIVALFLSDNLWWLLAAILCGYGAAWIGHFFFEKNRPASFRYPLWSFFGDWRMFYDIWSGRIRF